MQHKKSVTADYENHAITAYQQSYRSLNYGIINEWLRQHNISEDSSVLKSMLRASDSLIRRVATVVHTIDNKIAGTRGHRTMVVYRGISRKRYEMATSSGVLVNKAFTSSSVDLEHAKKFGTVVLCFAIPSSIGGLRLDNTYEDEVLIERNTQLVSFRERGVYSNVLVVDCTLAKYEPPSIEKRKDIEKTIKDQRAAFLEHLQQLDEDIDWDDLNNH